MLEGLKGGPKQRQGSSQETITTVQWSRWALKELGLWQGWGRGATGRDIPEMKSVDSLAGNQGQKYVSCQKPLGVSLYVCVNRCVSVYIRVTCMHACAYMPARLLAAWLHIGAMPASVHEPVSAQAQPHNCTCVSVPVACVSVCCSQSSCEAPTPCCAEGSAQDSECQAPPGT